MTPNNEYNKELLLAYQFLKPRYQTYLQSTRIKDDNERRAYAHTIHTIEHIATHCNITPKPNPNTTKRPEFYNTPYEE